MEPVYAVAEPGDTVWSLTKRSLTATMGREPTNAEISEAIAGAEVPSGDLSLIRPGEVVVLGVPGIALPTARNAPAGGRGTAPVDRAAVLREAARGVRPQPAPPAPVGTAPDSFAGSQRSEPARSSAAQNTLSARRILEQLGEPLRLGRPELPLPFRNIGDAFGRM